MEFKWNIFPGYTTLQLCNKVPDFMSKIERNHQKIFIGRIIFMSMFNDISWGFKDNEQECELSAKVITIYARRFSPRRWLFLKPGSEKKWYFIHESKSQGEWDRVAELMISIPVTADTQFSILRPLSRGTLKSKGGEKLSIHFCADDGTIETVFGTIVSANQLSIYGAVSDGSEEYKSCHVRTGRRVLVGHSDTLFVPTSLLMKTPTPSTDDLAQEDLLQKYPERVERL